MSDNNARLKLNTINKHLNQSYEFATKTFGLSFGTAARILKLLRGFLKLLRGTFKLLRGICLISCAFEHQAHWDIQFFRCQNLGRLLKKSRKSRYRKTRLI